MLADTYWMPLTCFFDWRRFAVFVPEVRAAEAAQILGELTDTGRTDAMQTELLRVRGYFTFAAVAQKQTDAFDLLMLEGFLRVSGCSGDHALAFASAPAMGSRQHLSDGASALLDREASAPLDRVASAPFDRVASAPLDHRDSMTNRNGSLFVSRWDGDACLATRSPTHPLAVVLRGEAFRSGGKGTRAFSNRPDEWEAQLRAFDSLHEHVLVPAAAQGWRVSLAVDIFAPDPLAERLAARMRMRGVEPVAWRVQPTPSHPKIISIVDSMVWAASRIKSTKALLVVRADIAFKHRLLMPPACAPGRSIIVPFQISAAFGSYSPSGHPRVAGGDMMMFVPDSRLAELLKVLRTPTRVDPAGNMHDMCSWMRSISFFVPSRGFDADSQKEWNPLYRIVGRSEAPPHSTNPAFLPHRRVPSGPQVSGC